MMDPVTKRALTITTVCPHCSNQFGLWRPQCPTCGWKVPSDVRDRAMRPVEKVGTRARETRAVKELVERAIKNGCIFCRRGVKLGRKSATTCPHCHELVHVVCLRLHHEACADFQTKREDELGKLGVKP